MSNGKRSQRHLPKSSKPAPEGGKCAAEKEPCRVDITPLVNEMHGLLDTFAASHKDDPQHTRKQLLWNRVTALSTLAAFIAGATYAAIAYRQWSDAGKTFKTEQRAWVGLRDAVADIAGVGRPLSVNLTVVNTGKTPALNLVLADATMTVLGNGAKKSIASPSGPTAVAPGDTTVVYLATPGTLTMNEALALQGEEPRISVEGTFSYHDIFGTLHKTGFCQLYPTQHKPNFFNCPGGGNWMN